MQKVRAPAVQRCTRNAVAMVYRLLTPAILIAAACHTQAADPLDTVLLSAPDGRHPTKVLGHVVDYNGRELRLRLGSGSERTFPSSRVVGIQTTYTEPHVEADLALAEGQFSDALENYRKALEPGGEGRTWVRRKILAGTAHSLRELGRIVAAGDTFLQIVESDPDTPYFDAIPLAWSPQEPSPQLENRALQWLDDQRRPAATLIGASYLLSTASRSAAVAQFVRLRNGPQTTISQLAEAQVWRTRVATARSEQIALWKTAIQGMHPSLRAGPYLVVGRALSVRKRSDDAALLLMRVPIQYPTHKALVARALLEAGVALGRDGHRDESAILYREVVTRHPHSREATEARNRLEGLAKPSAIKN